MKSPQRRSVLLVQTWWQDRVLRGVADYALKHNWELQCRMHWTHQVPEAKAWRGDGIIAYVGVSEWMKEESRKVVSLVRKAKVPVVQTQPFGDAVDAPRVIIAHEEIGRVAAEHLVSLGFEDLGFVTFDENALEQHRRRGFRQAVERAGCRFHALTPRSLARSMNRLPRPMGLAALNDLNALDVIRMCRDAGRRVPEEFAVIGADNAEIICDLAPVPLSSIDCNFEGQGYAAAALLDRLMDGERGPGEAIVVPPKGVVARRSTDTMAIPDLQTARLLRHLRDHFRDGRDVQQLIAELGLPRRRVHALFCQHVGRTPLQELTRLRVEHARRLMADPKLKLETVARESGFSSRFHLAEVFRRVLGQSPQACRRQGTAHAARE